MANTTQNTLYTFNCGGGCTIFRNNYAFVHTHHIIATTPGLGYPSNLEIQDMAMRDSQAFWYSHHQEVLANDTIWACAILADHGLMHRQDHPDIRRDRVLERLIDIGIYDCSEHTDLNNNLLEERSFQYAAVLMSVLWDWVHDLESEVCFHSGTVLLLY
jgi:hypothetical protein